MSVSVRRMDYRNPALLEYRKPGHTAEIVIAIIGVLVMLFPLVVDMRHPAPVISTEIIGFLAVLVGVAVFIDGENRHKKIQKAISGGIRYTAVVTAIRHQVKSVRESSNYDRVHLYCAECEFTDPETNEKYLLTSRYVLYNLNGTEGREVPVYVNPDDRSNYFVDLAVLAQEA